MEEKSNSTLIKAAVFAIDFGFIHLSFLLVRQWGFARSMTNDEYNSFLLIFGLTWVVSGFFNKIYRINASGFFSSIAVTFRALLVHVAIIVLIISLFQAHKIEPLTIICLYSASISLILGSRLLYKAIMKYYQFTGFDERKIVIIGATQSGFALYNYFKENEPAGYHFEGFFEDDHEISKKTKVVGPLTASAIKTFCLKNNIGEIYYTLPSSNKQLLREISRFADDNFIYMRIAPDYSEFTSDNGYIFLLNSVPVLTPWKEPLHRSVNATLKRIFDIVFSSLVIITVFPLLIPTIALAIYIDSPGPIFFKQMRPGKRNKLFDCYKFRTMTVNNNTEQQATRNDARITRVGAFLRKTSLDEIPQFFNVLLGNMSVVGPRPNMVSQLQEYQARIQNYRMRHFITPGITGYAQVNGYRGETKEIELMEKRVQYDVQYMENWTMWLDLKIIFLTVWNVLNGEKNAF